ncbi:hypothetical protein SNE40_017391 [Patella caerulea]|uniref:CARD domain-containing protein n=1 Tax=Patella caerulea TaxID=87958 RepID=A0AAN8PPZ4_PATCE
MPYRKGRLPDEQYDKIQSNYTELVADIKYDPMDLARSLFEYKVFVDDDLEKIKSEERRDDGGKTDAAAKLLDILLNCGSVAYDYFLKALDDKKYFNALFRLEPGFKTDDEDSTTSDGLLNTPLSRGTGIFQLGSIPSIQENEGTFTHLDKTNEDSPRLRTMKDNTKTILQDVIKKKFVKTRSFEEGLKILKNHSVLGILGAAGDGKTSLSMMIVNQFIQDNQQYTPLMINELDDLKDVTFNDDNYLLIIDDMYGKFNALKDRIDKWPRNFDNFRVRREKGQLAIIYIMRDYIYNSSKYQLDKYELFSEKTTKIFLHIGEFSLNDEEKKRFLKFYNISSDTIISKISGCFGFPAIANVCSKLKNDTLPINLGSSHDFLLAELNTFWKENKDIYSTLLLVFCLHTVREEDLKLGSPQDVRELTHKIIENVYKSFDLNIAKENVNELAETFIKVVERSYLLREFVEAPLFYHFSEKCMDMALEYCSFELLMALTKTTGQPENQFIIIHERYYDYFSLRCLKELKVKNTGIFLHPAFHDNNFLKDFLIKDGVRVLLSGIKTISLGEIQGSEECGNFVHYISLYGDLECLSTVLENLKLNVLNNEKTKMNWDVMGLAAISMIEPIKKLNLLRKHNYGDIVTLPHQAVYSGRFDVVQHVASFTVFDPKFLDNKSRTILHNACDSNHDVVEIIDFLMDNGFDVNAQDGDGCTPLHLAVRRGKKQNVSILITRGASVRVLDNNGRSSAHIICSVDDGRADIDVSGILNLLIEAGSPINSSDQRGRTPLQEAVFYVNRNCIETLLNLMVDIEDEIIQSIINDASQLSDTTLFRSILDELKRRHLNIDKLILSSGYRSLENLKALHSAGVDFNFVDDQKCSLLHVCCNYGTVETVNYLINDIGLDVNNTNIYGQTAATYCCISKINPVEKLKIILLKRGNLDIVDNNNFSLLHISCKCGSISTVNYFINEIGFDVNLKNKFGLTPAAYCTISAINPVGKLKFLSSKGGKLDVVDNNNRSLLYLSCGDGTIETVKYLVNEIGLDVNREDINGSTPALACALSKINPVDKLKFLSLKGGNLEAVNNNNCSLLHVSCEYSTTETVKYLVDEIGLDVNDKNIDDCTPAMYCAISKTNPIEKLKFLSLKGGKLDVVDNDNRDLLHYSCGHGITETVKYLINDHGLDVNHKDKNGCAPAIYCAASKINPVDKLKVLSLKGGNLDAVDSKNCNLLHYSCAEGVTETVKYLVNEIGLGVNDKNIDDWTPAMYCAASKINPVEKLKFLSLKGGKLDVVDNDNRGLLHYSCGNGITETLKYLINDHGLDVNHKDTNGCAPAIYCAASKINPVDKLELLSLKGGNLDVVDNKNCSLLHHSCNECITIKYLVNEIGLDVNHQDINGHTPATYCATSEINPVDSLKFLSLKGCKLDVVDNMNRSLLHYSCTGGTTETVKYLVNKIGLDVNKKDIIGFTPAMYCAASKINPVDKLKFLSSKGCKLDVVDDGGKTLLHISCSDGTFATVKYLVNEIKSDVNKKDKSDLPPTYSCIMSRINPVEKLKFLLSKGVTLDIPDSDKCTLLGLCCNLGAVETLTFLINEMGLDMHPLYSGSNMHPLTNLDKRIVENYLLFQCFKTDFQQMEKINFLIWKGAKITICRPYKEFFKDDFDRCSYLLHHSCYIGTLDTVKFLVNDAGYDVNFTNHKNMTSLFCCLNSQIEQMGKINFLITKGAKITICRPYKDIFKDDFDKCP